MKLSLSVEETNRLRLQVGLKPIPVDKDVPSGENEDDGVLQISLAETNRLRKQVGLKPIPADDPVDVESENYNALERKRRQADDIDKLRASLNKKKNDLKTKQRMGKGGILDRIENSAMKKDSGVLDFDSWLEEVGKEIKNDRVKKLSFKKKDKPSRKPAVEDSKEDSAAITEKAVEETGIVMTSKDVNVLEDDHSDEDDDERSFENRQLKQEELLKKALNERKGVGKLVTLDEQNGSAEWNGSLSEDSRQEDPKKRKLISLQIESSDDESDDHTTGIEYDESGIEAKKISKFIKRDVSKFKKSKKRSAGGQVRTKVFDTELVEKTFTPVLLDIDDDDEENDLERTLNVARQNALKSRKVDIELPEKEVEAEHRGEVIDEGDEFINNIRVEDPKDEKTNTSAREATEHVDETPSVESTSGSRYRAILELESDQNYHTYGVSNVLNALKSGNKASNGKTNAGEVEIVYTDDSGKVLNTKEAFKYLSHKFHGSKKR